MAFVLMHVPNPDKETAEKIGRQLLEKRLCACVNILPVSSAYWWKGKIENENEFVLIVKTSEEKAEEAEAEIKKAHPYDIPCIIRINVSANEDYEKWLKTECGVANG